MKHTTRPLSPHLQIYKPQLTSVLSILHRFTGLFLVVGAIIIAGWLSSLALGSQYFLTYQAMLRTIPGKIVLVVWSFSMFYHLFNGIRHLFWDAGCGHDLKNAYLTGWLVVIGSTLATCALWLSSFFLG